MTGVEVAAWAEKNNAYPCGNFHFNNIDYTFYKMSDNWIAIFEHDEGEFIPRIQAADMEHAESWCNMHERLRVPAAEIVPQERDELSLDDAADWER